MNTRCGGEWCTNPNCTNPNCPSKRRPTPGRGLKILSSDTRTKRKKRKLKDDAERLVDKTPVEANGKLGVAHDPEDQTRNLAKKIASMKY